MDVYISKKFKKNQVGFEIMFPQSMILTKNNNCPTRIITFSYQYQKNWKKIESLIINFNFIVKVITLIINFILKAITQIIKFIFKILTLVINLLDYHHSIWWFQHKLYYF
jgi:hypothetical protein